MCRRLRIFALALMLMGCNAVDSLVDPHAALKSSLAVLDGSTGGNSNFYFLPPIVASPDASGTFDGLVSPTVEVCEWTASGCVEPALVTFTMTTGPGSETLRVDIDDELYVVNWHLRDFGVTAGEIYRISVIVRGQELGYAEVLIADNGQGARNAATLGYIGLVDNRTLPIKFRLEEGAVTRWASIGAQHVTSCAVTDSGRGHCWGGTASPTILGDGTTSPSASPVPVAGGLTFAEIGTSHVICGVTTSGDGYCWGDNLRGRVGNGSGSRGPFPSPGPVAGGHAFSSIRGEHDTNCAVTTDGIGYCWGGNWAGQLGVGYVGNHSEWSPTPRPVAGGLTFVAPIVQGGAHGCGVGSGGVAHCWGKNDVGQLGDGSLATRGAPAPVSGTLIFEQIDAGWEHTCGVTESGSVYCWGDNSKGQLGTGDLVSSTTPVPILGTLSFASVTLGHSHTCALTDGGAAYCWGRNVNGNLGDGTTTDRTSPVLVIASTPFTQVVAGRDHTCAITTTAAAMCWGKGTDGALGDGAFADSPVPVFVSEPM